MQIEDALYEYLVLFEELSLPGIGTLRLSRNHAIHDIAGKKIYPPTYIYTLSKEEKTPARKLFHWVKEEMGVPEVEAIRLVNEFAYDLKASVTGTNDVKWDKVGRFTLVGDGSIGFESETPHLLTEEPLDAEKLIDDSADYTILAGDSSEVPSSVMAETMEAEKQKKDIAWLIGWILLIAAIMFTGIYFSKNGFKVSSTGNKMQIKTEKGLKK